MEQKKDIRNNVLKNRNLLSEVYRNRASKEIHEKLFEQPEFLSAKAILCYASYKTEVETISLITHLLNCGKSVYLPRVHDHSAHMSQMDFYQITSIDQLQKGYQGILEPTVNKGQVPYCGMEEGLMIIPCVAFCDSGDRIGYGKGFYDRYIHRYPNLFRVFFAYDVQAVSSFPTNQYDKKAHVIITESRCYEC